MNPASGCWLIGALLVGGCGRADITVGSKNFTESILLGEIVAQQLERSGLTVERRFNLGGTFVSHQALINGQIDLYVEYTGTAHAAILELPRGSSRADVQRELDSIYAERWGVTWTEPLGFNNTFAMLIRGEAARQHLLTRYSELAPFAAGWRAGFGYEFAERADGYPGLAAAYGFSFGGQPAVMELGLTYRALADRRVDVIAGNSTDGLIDALDLVHLEDDLGYFPAYDAAPIVRHESLVAHPVVAHALAALGGRIDDATMRRLNHQVDVERRRIPETAAEFLTTIPTTVPN